MAGKGKYISSETWEDEWFMSLNNQERLIFLYLLTSRARVMSGIITASLSSMVDSINSKQAKEKYKEITRYIMKHNKRPDNIPEGFVYYDEDYVEEILKNFEDKEKIIILKDNKLLMVNYYKHQDFDNQSMLQGVLKDIIDLVKSYGSFFTEKLENNKSFYNSLITKIEIMIRDKALPREKMIDQDKRLVEEMINLIRLIPKMFKNATILNLCLRYIHKNKLASNEDINELINLTNGTQSIHPVDTVSTPERQPVHNRIELKQIKLNQTKTNEIKQNDSLGLSSSFSTSKKNSSSPQVESSKNPPLGGQVFEDSSPEAKLSARVKEKKKKKKEEETREERKARKQKERLDACDLALTLMKVYKGVELRRKLKKILQPYEPEEYDQVMETPRARYWNIPAKQYYFSERSIPDAQIEQAERVVEKVNEYVMDNFDADEQIPALNPLCSETVYKILNDYFQGSEDAFLEELFSHFDKLKEEGRLHKIRNLDLVIYSFGTNVTIDDLLNKDLL